VALKAKSGLDRLIVEAHQTQTHIHTHTPCRNALDKWSASRAGRYLYNRQKHKRLTSIPSVWFETVVPAIKRPHTYASDSMTTLIGYLIVLVFHSHRFVSIRTILPGTNIHAEASLQTTVRSSGNFLRYNYCRQAIECRLSRASPPLTSAMITASRITKLSPERHYQGPVLLGMVQTL
jgi:hypothetical protein